MFPFGSTYHTTQAGAEKLSRDRDARVSAPLYGFPIDQTCWKYVIHHIRYEAVARETYVLWEGYYLSRINIDARKS